MTVTIQSGPPWVGLDLQGNLTGTAPAPGTYSVVLESSSGAYTATKAVSIIASALNAISLAQTAVQAELGQIVLSFTASVVSAAQAIASMELSFTAAAGTLVPFIFPDSNEPNNTVDDLLTSLPLGGFAIASLSNGVPSVNTMPAGDTYDWFSFLTTTAGPVTFALTDLTRPADATATTLGIDLALYEQSSTTFEVWSTALTPAAPTATSPSQLASRYYIRVSNPAGRISQYKLTVSW